MTDPKDARAKATSGAPPDAGQPSERRATTRTDLSALAAQARRPTSGVGLRNRRPTGPALRLQSDDATRRPSARAVAEAEAARQSAMNLKKDRAREEAANKTQRLQAFMPARRNTQASEEIELDPSFNDDFDF